MQKLGPRLISWTVMTLFMLLYGPILRAEEAGAHESCATQRPPSNVIAGKNATSLEDLSQNLSCATLPVGSSKVVKISKQKSLTGVSAEYRLVRTDEHNFVIQYRLQETSGRDTLRNAAQKCLSQVNPILRKGSGDHFQIEISDDVEIPVIKLAEAELFERNESTSWRENITCSTIVHELFHHLGFVDLYKEDKMALKPQPDGTYLILEHITPGIAKAQGAGMAYDCRIVGPDADIMSDNELALKNAENGVGVLIHAAYAREIQFAGCPTKNQAYHTCAKLSHKTSLLLGGTCGDVPPSCAEAANYDWLR